MFETDVVILLTMAMIKCCSCILSKTQLYFTLCIFWFYITFSEWGLVCQKDWFWPKLHQPFTSLGPKPTIFFLNQSNNQCHMPNPLWLLTMVTGPGVLKFLVEKVSKSLFSQNLSFLSKICLSFKTLVVWLIQEFCRIWCILFSNILTNRKDHNFDDNFFEHRITRITILIITSSFDLMSSYLGMV